CWPTSNSVELNEEVTVIVAPLGVLNCTTGAQAPFSVRAHSTTTAVVATVALWRKCCVSINANKPIPKKRRPINRNRATTSWGASILLPRKKRERNCKSHIRDLPSERSALD